MRVGIYTLHGEKHLFDSFADQEKLINSQASGTQNSQLPIPQAAPLVTGTYRPGHTAETHNER